jgi:hypothetical protein
MEYSDAQIKQYIARVVSETKATANVDTGFLKRSIRGNWFRGIATFREVFYGAYNDNAKLIENAKRIMPSDIPWRVIFVDEDGRETEVEGKTRTGRTISRKQVTSGNVGTENIKLLQKLIKANNAKKEKDSTGEGNRKVDN